MTSPTSHRRRRRRTQGYALLMVIMGGVVLSVLAVTLLRGVGMNRADFARQTNSVRALYAAESAVAVGVDELRKELEVDTNPSLTALAAPSLADVSFDAYSVAYVNPNNNYAISATACVYPDDTPCGGGTCSVDNVCRYTTNAALTSGDYAGLTALQVPIQVLASVDIRGAKATIADIVQLNLIPIFQFGLFFDGDMPFINPGDMDIRGIAHTNGDFIPFRPGTTIDLNFHETVTAAGLIKHCTIFDTSLCMDASNGVNIMSSASSAFEILTLGREDQASDADHAAYLETRFGDGASDSTRGVTALNPPLRLTAALPDVEGRPDQCGSLSNSAAPQAAGIEIVRRPTGGYTYGNGATTGFGVVYGPTPATTLAATGVSNAAHEDCAAAPAGHAHCQQVARSVPVLSVSEGTDDQGVASERFFWKAHIRIIDGIWYGQDGSVIFDPEDWSLAGTTAATDAAFRRAMKYARVTRYSWFWDPRESRMYAAGNRYQRGLQMRTTDIDLYALKVLLQDPVAVTEIFAGAGIPSGGIILYVSETYDPTYDDNLTTAPPGSNVRNFLNFHVMENDQANADRCMTSAEAPSRGVPGKSPCEVGFHPYYIWGDGAAGLEGGNQHTSLTTNPADPRIPSIALPTGAAGLCYNPIDRATADYSMTALAPCVEAGATPTGPENAVRLVRGTHMPEDSSGNKIGFTIATDNRLYVYGDVNTDTSNPPAQGLAGKVSLVSDSITLLSQAFSDRVMQRGAGAGVWQPLPLYRSHPGQPAASTPHFGGAYPSTTGFAPNLCSAWNGVGGVEPRDALPLFVYASLLMGDVPDCPGAGAAYFEGATGGGVNNFPRFLEHYRRGTVKGVTIRGSIVSLFRAVQGNSRFIAVSGSPSATDWVPQRTATPYDYNGSSQSCVYSAPDRDWGFDAALLDPANLPPGTPRLVQVDRVRWVRR